MKNTKHYPLKDSFFYRLRNRRRLEEFLSLSKGCFRKSKISKILKYDVFEIHTGTKLRTIEAPTGILKTIHKTLYNYLQRIETPSWLISGKKGVSYLDNSKIHKDSKYIVTADIDSFYPSCSSKMVYNLFLNKFKMSNDIASLLTKITTINGHIPTGSPLSQWLAFWSYYDCFNDIYAYCKNFNMKFSLYVDDMTFSCDDMIRKKRVWEIDKIIRSYGLKMKRKKNKSYRKNEFKKVTGVVITPDNKLNVPNKLRLKILIETNKIIKDYNYGKEIDLRRIRGLVSAARLIQPEIYHNILDYIDDLPHVT